MNITINNQTGGIILPKVEQAILGHAQKAIERLGDPHETYTVNAHRVDDNHINVTLVHHLVVLVIDELEE